jgi:hypothetical protein
LIKNVLADDEADSLKHTPLFYPQITQITQIKKIILGLVSDLLQSIENRLMAILKKSQKSAEICVICG